MVIAVGALGLAGGGVATFTSGGGTKAGGGGGTNFGAGGGASTIVCGCSVMILVSIGAWTSSTLRRARYSTNP